MKSLKGRFIRTNILMIVFSAALVLVVTLLLLFLFSLEEIDGINRIIVVIRDIAEGTTEDHDKLVLYCFIWVASVVLSVLMICLLLSANLFRTVMGPIRQLQKAAENIAEGNLAVEVLACEDKELNELCSSFDKIRKRLKSNALQELKVEEERNMLIANLSHDMRTPITTIKGYVEGIEDGIASSPEKMKQYLDTIYSKALILERLVDNMTEYSELELGRMQYVFEYVDFNSYLRDLAEEYQLDAAEKGFRLETCLEGKPMTVVADRNKLKRVFDNLISNAMKYNKQNGRVSLTSETDGKGVLLCVADSGTGIKKEDISLVFDGFYRGDAARTNIKGNGLGLAISKQIIEGHHGKIWMKSEEGMGTQVFIYLPLREKK